MCKFNSEDILSFVYCKEDPESRPKLLSLIRKTVSIVNIDLIRNDVVKMQDSVSNPMYREIKTHVRLENFLDINMEWNLTRLAVQLRSNMSQITMNGKIYRLNYLENIFYPEKSPFCTTCNKQLNETILHIIFECESYSNMRNKYLVNYLNFDGSNYIEFLNNLNKDKLESLYRFLKEIFNLRKDVIDVSNVPLTM